MNFYRCIFHNAMIDDIKPNFQRNFQTVALLLKFFQVRQRFASNEQ